MIEEWRKAPGWPAYEVSNLGRVRRAVRLPNGRKQAIKALSLWSTGYLMVTLSEKPKFHKVQVHRLVAEAFIGAPPTRQHCVAHGDGNKLNNSVLNLRWATHAENAADMLVHGTRPMGESHGMAKLTEEAVQLIREQCAAGERQRDVARRHGVHQATVHRIVAGKAWHRACQVIGERAA